MNAEKLYKAPSFNVIQPKKSNKLGFVDNRLGAITQALLIRDIQNNGEELPIQQKSLFDLNKKGIIQRVMPDFSDKTIIWKKTGTRIEKHCGWEMTYLAILERPDEIVPFGTNVNSRGQQIYILTWPILFHERFGSSYPKSWKDGHILFAYDAIAKIAYVFHSGPGG